MMGTIVCDFCVAGGGLAGICAAVAGARMGLSVVLINDRPVLGGNASSEYGVTIEGAGHHGYNCAVYSRENGSAAAPTAGLHFTRDLLREIEEMGVDVVHVTLHVGLGTFRPVKEENITDHLMHTESYNVTEEAAARINAAKARGGRVIAVGTTSCRTLESVGDEQGIVHSGSGDTSIFIYPGYTFKVLDGLITNFHLPESTLIMLVSAFSSREHVLHAYETAVQERYRFFSFGDAMLLL